MMKCIIIEDEQPAQELLSSFIERTPFLQCMGIYESCLDLDPKELGESAILFLDIRLPEVDGLSFIKSVPNPPNIIVTTAFSEYAVEAFNTEVVDYLLKPFSFERFIRAVSRARNKRAFEEEVPDKSIFIYSNKTHFRIQITDILFVKAEVDYVSIVTAQQKYLVLDSLKNWKTYLERWNFIQIHRSYVANLDLIDKISGNQLFIKDQSLSIGKKYKASLMQRITS